VRKLQAAALGNFAPDLTIILDVEPSPAWPRRGTRRLRKTVSSSSMRDFHMRLRDGFLSIAARSLSAALSLTQARIGKLSRQYLAHSRGTLGAMSPAKREAEAGSRPRRRPGASALNI
jgi:dTMP kinase